MNFVIVFDHPYGASASENIPNRRSYTAALLASVTKGLRKAGHQIDLIDLHKDGFNPVMSAEDLTAWRKKKTIDPLVADYQRRMIGADYIVFIFPIWWECMPALTKGFLDKVFVKGIIYDEPKKGRFVNLLPQIKGVLLLTTMSTPGIIYRLVFGNAVTKILFRGTFRLMGIHNLHWYNYTGVERRSLKKRMEFLDKTERHFARL